MQFLQCMMQGRGEGRFVYNRSVMWLRKEGRAGGTSLLSKNSRFVWIGAKCVPKSGRVSAGGGGGESLMKNLKR